VSLPGVCVALSVRNGGPYLAESIESVLAQEGVPFELRIYDNASSDGSLEVARGYLWDARVRVTENPPGMWMPGSLNRAAAETERELFVPWAADDRMLPGNLARKAEALAQTGAEIAFGQMVHMDADGTPRQLSSAVAGTERRRFAACEWLGLAAPLNCVLLPSVMLRTATLRSVGGFDQRLVLSCDWRLWLTLAMRVAAVWEPGALVEYREHGESHSSSAWRDGSWAIDLPATMRSALADPACPPLSDAQREGLLLAVHRYLASELHRGGHRLHQTSRLPAYASLGDAAVRLSPSQAAREGFLAGVHAAGLVLPQPSGRIAIAPALEPGAVAAALDAARALVRAGLGAGVVGAVGEADVERAAEVYGAALAAGDDIAVDLVPGASFDALLARGGIALVPYGSPLAERAEAAGVPGLHWDLPDPLAAAPDLSRYDRIPEAA
jgi:hypothetical protein